MEVACREQNNVETYVSGAVFGRGNEKKNIMMISLNLADCPEKAGTKEECFKTSNNYSQIFTKTEHNR